MLTLASVPIYICRNMMRDLARRNDKEVGFIDPYIVFSVPKKDPAYDIWRNETGRNLRRFLVNQKNKRYILFPYNFRWVLLSCAYLFLLTQFL